MTAKITAKATNNPTLISNSLTHTPCNETEENHSASV